MFLGRLTFKIPQDLKEMVIRLWTEANTRKSVAKSCGVSEGTVYNIVEEWKQLIGQRDAEASRELSTSLKRNGIDIGQCVQGFRIHLILKKIGVTDEDELESFLSAIYEKCSKEIIRKQQVTGKSGDDVYTPGTGITPETIASCIKELLNFSDRGNVKLSDIPRYIEQKRMQKEAIVKEMDTFMKKRRVLVREALDAQESYKRALEKKNVTEEQLHRYSRMSAELAKAGLDIDRDISLFVGLIDTLSNTFGFDAERIISEFQDVNILSLKKKHL
jgi:hypothetical protein